MIHVWRAKNYRWTLTVLENARVPEPLGVLREPRVRPPWSLGVSPLTLASRCDDMPTL